MNNEKSVLKINTLFFNYSCLNFATPERTNARFSLASAKRRSVSVEDLSFRMFCARS